jgi:CheY-like chemotaxis protein
MDRFKKTDEYFFYSGTACCSETQRTKVNFKLDSSPAFAICQSQPSASSFMIEQTQGTRSAPANVLVSIVDDDESVREALKSLMLSVGFQAEVFSSAAEFLDSDSRSVTKCLIVDVHMPLMTGLELHCRLKRERCQIPVIFISARDDHNTRLRVEKAGAAGFLTKPFSAEALLNAIATALDRTRKR